MARGSLFFERTFRLADEKWQSSFDKPNDVFYGKCSTWNIFVMIDRTMADEWQIECEKSMGNIFRSYLLVKVLPVKMIKIKVG